MSKVVHLSDEAHALAKVFCKKNGLKMSDWVASLIEDAVSSERVSINTSSVAPTPLPLAAKPSVAPPVAARPLAAVPPPAPMPAPKREERIEDLPANAVPKKKKLVELAERPEEEPAESKVNPWEQPSFWNSAGGN